MTKLAWRRTWFQIHKWIGLILAILIIPLSLSGAALVWHDALDRIVNPARYQISGTTQRTPDVYAEAARGALRPGERIAQLGLPEGHGPIAVAAAPASADPGRRGPPPRTMIYLDPPTARVLDVAGSQAGLVRFLHILHGSLQIPGLGRTIVGWIGVAMLLSSMTGLWLWWPTVGSWSRGLRWRRHRNTDSNLHHMIGFWIALPLFILSLTGVWISFPGVFGGGRGGPDRGGQRAVPLAEPGQPLDLVVARAASVRRGALRSIAWPTSASADWTVTYANGQVVKVADDNGVAVAAPARRPGGLARTMRRLHDGGGMGIVWQIVIFLGGIAPAVLAVTGIIMWWRAREWRSKAASARGGRTATR